MTDNEGITGIANGAINALKGSPALLVLVLLNLIGIGLGAYFLHDLANDVGDRQRLILERCLPQGK
jgi:hypothetical protein